MEASQTPSAEELRAAQERQTQAGRAEAETTGDSASAAQGGADERNPARDQAPVATDAQEAIIGDPGLRDEQQPVASEGAPTNVDTPVRTSAPPPSAQSGVPLSEDRTAE